MSSSTENGCALPEPWEIKAKDKPMTPATPPSGGEQPPILNTGVLTVGHGTPADGILEMPIVISAVALEQTGALIRQCLGEPEVKQPANDYQPAAIGLSGFAQTGKTTVANYIESEFGYRRQHIAEPLRDMLRTLLRRYRYTDETIDRYLTGDLKEEVIPELGVTSRHAQITIGTEWGRELINQDIWADLWALEASWAGGLAMNDSVRFPNEENAIRHELGGFTILVTRAGTKPVAFKWGFIGEKLYDWFGCMWGVHDSERVDRLNPDHIIDNNGSLEELYEQIDGILADELCLR